jgi:hypothetical protein
MTVLDPSISSSRPVRVFPQGAVFRLRRSFFLPTSTSFSAFVPKENLKNSLNASHMMGNFNVIDEVGYIEEEYVFPNIELGVVIAVIL